ncbi:sensor histidine kinase [Oleiagrimonas soli]|uniref:histidine kinase n=1 Tax=Oleiagrimonas soli TaxID=1543381 RepID=A0A841KCS3_9GAMM|nr:HAMP domain-containing sensor histidine kinase [Oleiagrimonas soli]MBB6182982.1 hypothetical protein [Oleiagrimonas soli]
MIRRRPTSAFRLALLLAGLFTLFSLLTAAVLWIGTAHEARVEQRRAIGADARDLALLSYQHGMDALSTEIEERVILNAGLSRWYALYAANGIKLAGNLEHAPKHTGWDRMTFTPRATLRAPVPSSHLLALYTVRTAQHGWLVVGRDAFYLHRMRDVAGRIFVVALLFIVAASLLVGALVGRRLSRRVTAMSIAAEAISAGQLERRMPRRHNGDELDLIAATINGMLDRIAALLADVRRVGADIAHDLRTPLTRVRQRLERLQRHPPEDAATLQQTLEQALAEIDELLHVFQALLHLARVESGEMQRDFTEVPLRPLLQELFDTYAAVAEGEDHRLLCEATADAIVRGDRALLMQALVNLVENAIRHTPPGTTIRIGLARDADGVRLCVRDDGPGIPDAYHEQVLEPFLRLESSRHTQGNGLGLALVRSVAELHGAELRLEQARPGLSVSLRFAFAPAR